jgi:hypothetical protein
MGNFKTWFVEGILRFEKCVDVDVLDFQTLDILTFFLVYGRFGNF